MPPRVQLARTARAGLSETRSTSDIFYCPSCSLWRLDRTAPRKTLARLNSTRQSFSSSRKTQTTTQYCSTLAATPKNLNGATGVIKASLRRSATTWASSTAINPPQHIPPVYHDLHASLEKLRDRARDYVNQSRLHLALRGLESANPTIRIGILGLGRGGENAARRLVRLLLADPLEEEAAWERILSNQQVADGKALLLCYGDPEDIPPQNPLMETMYIPSRVLHRNNLEILITSLNSSSGPHGESDPAGLLEAVLVPPLQTTIASAGRAGFVRNPVHRALIVGEGIEGCLEFGRFEGLLNGTLQGAEVDDDLGDNIRVAVSLPQRPSQQSAQHGSVTAVDIDQASSGLDVFRQDVANGVEFNTKWQASNISSLKAWLTSASTPTAAAVPEVSASPPLNPALAAHITSILHSAKFAIDVSETAANLALNTTVIADSTRSNLQNAITVWSQYAHTDLQVSTARALASRSWRRTSWSRLFWRVDDVGVAAEDVLRSHWLLDAEMGLAFLAGRVKEAGLYDLSAATRSSATKAIPSGYPALEPEAAKPVSKWSRFFGKAPPRLTNGELFNTNAALAKVQEDTGVDLVRLRPWPLIIHVTRQQLLHTLVPALQARAQSLLLQTSSTIAATSALGAWIYVATAGVGIPEAGAAATLGLVWSLRRLQRKWEESRRVWEDEVRERGRVVLRFAEEELRGTVARGGGAELRSEDVEGWVRAREALEEVRGELEKVR